MTTRARVARAMTAAGLALLISVLTPSTATARTTRPGDISVPDGFRIEAAVKGLDAPTMVAFDDQGRLLVAESGYLGGGESRVTRVEPDGTKTVLAGGAAFGEEVPVTSVAFHEGKVYVVHAGTVSTIEPGGRLSPVITGLPGQGDHQANELVFSGGFMYLSIGTVTNSGVVGSDNAVFGWLGKPELRQLHDVPCQDVVLTGDVFDSENPLGDEPERVRTTPFSPFGTVQPPGTVVKGSPKCNGAILRARPDGSNLEVFAWGLRNPFGLEMGPDGSLYATDHGFDARGSRPIENAWDCLWRIGQGGWLGSPDFSCGVPVTDSRFKPRNKPQPQFIVANHPTSSPPSPVARFDPHAATNGFAFSPSRQWGTPDTAYIALFGDMTPGTGTVSRPKGVKVVKVDTTTGRTTDFLRNKTRGQASRHSAGGLEHPSAVAFAPDGAMYVTDWSIARPTEEGLKLEPGSGVVWKVVAEGDGAGLPGGPSLLYTLLATLTLAAATVVVGAGRARTRRPVDGLLAGVVAGLVMGLFTMAVAARLLNLPWHAPPRVLATMVMGRAALANILEFDLVSFLVGTVVLVVLTALLGVVFASAIRATAPVRIVVAGLLFGLTGWALLQYFLLPALFPLVTEKGFPPRWYAFSFGLYGLVLGALLAFRPRPEAAPPTPGPGRAAPAQPGEDRIDAWREEMRRLREQAQ
ncbi:MAG: PQQ-dependent sugar dehydrogenase [Actinomycetota bacterium]|nr:PQQ-dependent sugar dehydrogenase [Actinomycetota bacterium]